MAAIGNYEVVVSQLDYPIQGGGPFLFTVPVPDGKVLLSGYVDLVINQNQWVHCLPQADGKALVVQVWNFGSSSTPRKFDVHLIVAEMGC